MIKINKNQRSHKNYLKIIKKINHKNIKFKIDSEEKLNLIIVGVNEFMVRRIDSYSINEIINYFTQNMKRYRVLVMVMNEYSIKAKATYKEQIAKKLTLYSYKTVSNIIDETIDKGYFKYVRSPNKNDKKKIKSFRPSSALVSSYINWTLENVAAIDKFLKITK
ncbi:hypothetical protein N9366_00330 [Candidatus Pelagibacter sp.]|nr:hypothetical protein [Candidatus Pelagibacter sp.]|tara:strand:- start:479 stop:970 length:492 start_codon:yes stop_codon:yes gene_type:complete